MLDARIAPHGLGVALADGRRAFVKRDIAADGGSLRELWALALASADAAGWRGRVRLCIADAFCFLDSLEGEFAAQTARVADGIVRAAVAELLPEGGRDHEVRWQLQSDGRHALVLAVPAPLLQSLHDDTATLGLRIASIDAEFVAHWNRCGRRLGLRDGVAAFTHRGTATLVRLRRGAITGFSFEHVGLDVDALDAAARRLCARFGDEPEGARALVSADEWPGHALGRWTLHRPVARRRWSWR